jgi:hypothetical protein
VIAARQKHYPETIEGDLFTVDTSIVTVDTSIASEIPSEVSATI